MRPSAWFPRLQDVPGLELVLPIELDLAERPGHDYEPRTIRGREQWPVLMEDPRWPDLPPDPRGPRPSTPCDQLNWMHRRLDDGRTQESEDGLLRRLCIRLSVPGTLPDYLRAFTPVGWLTSPVRSRDPGNLVAAEYLLSRHVQLLLLLHPELLDVSSGSDGVHEWRTSIPHLVDLYAAEGADLELDRLESLLGPENWKAANGL